MPQTIIQAKDFLNRQQLEDHVRNLIGLTAETKLDYKIKGTSRQLAKLQLSGTTIFWGISCHVTYAKPVEKHEKPQRGKIHKSGLNLNKS